MRLKDYTQRMMVVVFRKLRNEGIIKILKEIYHKIKPNDDLSYTNNTSENMSFEDNMDFSQYNTEIKTIALYLPQFHEIPENNKWWGDGFTEWKNVKKASPKFPGHYEPREPLDNFGYYDLTDVSVISKQVKLAKQHGIYGFGIYYYWFSGHKLLEKPIDLILKHKEIQFPFMLIWANENWTRTWDRLNNNILIKQNYSEEDPRNFVIDIKKYIDDPRYIKIDNKPVIGIYAPDNVPNLKEFLNKWRKTAIEINIGEIFILVCSRNSNSNKMGIVDLIDGEYEFPPLGKGFAFYKKTFQNAYIFDYSSLVSNAKENDYKSHKPFFRGSMLLWDNSARKNESYHSWTEKYSLKQFYYWNRINIYYLRKNYDTNHRFLFVNAWNEWGEGTYLEPDLKYGYANINTLSKAIFDLPYNQNKTNEPVLIDCVNTELSAQRNCDYLLHECSIAVHIHIYYLDLIPEILEKLSSFPYVFDLYISTDSEKKKTCIYKLFQNKCFARKIIVETFSNIGRDVAPLLMQMQWKRLKEYKYLCHIHTKKTLTIRNGDTWRKYLFENLMGNKKIIENTMSLFESDISLGLIYPSNIDFMHNSIDWGSNKKNAECLCNRIHINSQLPDNIEFPAGNMFWCRTQAVKQLFENIFSENDFPKEEGQVDATIMHAVERIWCHLVFCNGYTYKTVRSISDNRPLR